MVSLVLLDINALKVSYQLNRCIFVIVTDLRQFQKRKLKLIISEFI